MKLEIHPSGLANGQYLVLDMAEEGPFGHVIMARGSLAECTTYVKGHTPVDCPAEDQWNCKYCAQAKSCELHSHTPAKASGRWSASAPALQQIPNYTTEEAKKLVEDFRAAHPNLYTAFDPAGPALDYTPLEQRTLAAALEQELQPKARPLNRMELALLDWWRDRRPVFDDSVAHALEPTINCHSPAEDKMANMAAELFMQACENGLLSYEPALAPVEDL